MAVWRETDHTTGVRSPQGCLVDMACTQFFRRGVAGRGTTTVISATITIPFHGSLFFKTALRIVSGSEHPDSPFISRATARSRPMADGIVRFSSRDQATVH